MGKSILRPAFDQSNCKKTGPALILIEHHIIISVITRRFIVDKATAETIPSLYCQSLTL